MGRRLLLLFLLLLFLLGVANLRVHMQCRAEFRKANHFLKKSRLKRAVRHYSHVIRWYTPFNRYTPVAIRRIHKIGKYAYDKGEWELALFCFQQLRNSLASLRSFYQPYKEGLDESHRYLALLFTNLPSQTARSPRMQRQHRLELQRTLQRSVPLHPASSWGIAISLLLWVLGLLIVLWAPGMPQWLARLLTGVSMLGFASWLGLLLWTPL